MRVEAARLINPGERGEALPVVVRLYQLKGTRKFDDATLDEVLDRDKEVLADEMLASAEITVNPAEKLEPVFERAPGAVFLGAVALFRKPTGGAWRVVKKLLPPDPDHCQSKAQEKDPSKERAVRLFLDENRLELR